jgi:hypothetical protein
LDKILVAALPAGTPSNARPRTADEIAKQHNLIAPLVKRWAQAIASAPSDDPALGDWRAVPDADKPALAEKYARRFAEAWERPDDPDLAPLRKRLFDDKTGLLALPDKPESFYTDAAKATLQKAADALKPKKRARRRCPS